MNYRVESTGGAADANAYQQLQDMHETYANEVEKIKAMLNNEEI